MFSSVTRNVTADMKQYEVDGQAVGPSYKRQTAEEKANRTPELIAETSRAQLYTKRNFFSPFLKRIVKPSCTRSPEQNALGNKLAALVNKYPERAKHFSIDFYVGKKEGHDIYMSRRIHGFSLDNDERLGQALQSGELSKEKISEKMGELADAVEWLNAQGYFHNDISHLGNIMYDTQSKVFVLIDSECADRGQKFNNYDEKQLVDTFKDIILPNKIAKLQQPLSI